MAGTTRHKVAKECFDKPECWKEFRKPYEEAGEFFLYTEPVTGEPNMLWAVFQSASN